MWKLALAKTNLQVASLLLLCPIWRKKLPAKTAKRFEPLVHGKAESLCLDCTDENLKMFEFVFERMKMRFRDYKSHE